MLVPLAFHVLEAQLLRLNAPLGLSLVQGRVLAPLQLPSSLRSIPHCLATSCVIWALIQAREPEPVLLAQQGLRATSAVQPPAQELPTHLRAGESAEPVVQVIAALIFQMSLVHLHSRFQALIAVCLA